MSTVRFYRHGWHSWSQTGWVDPSTPRTRIAVEPYRLMGDDPVHETSTWSSGLGVGAIETRSGIKLLGSLGMDGRVEVIDGQLIPRGPGPWFEAEGAEEAVFDAYADALGGALGSRASEPGPVWCSWYSYYGAIDEGVIGTAIDDLEDLPFKTVQVDDGWQVDIGDWMPNDRFGGGMNSLAGRIRDTGRRAGLWLAPFLANAGSRLVEERPEMVLKGGDGAPVAAAFNWGGDAYALDVTRPDVIDFVQDTVARVVSWGFDYLKLDFLYAGAFNGKEQRESDYRTAVEAIRAAAGDDVFLLACGAPIIPSVGVFDGLRVGPDAAPYWDDVNRTVGLADRAGPAAADAIATSAARLWLRRVIAVDPDVVYFRSRNCDLTAEQRSLLIDLARVAGFRATSDPIAWLDAGQRGELESFLTERPLVIRKARGVYEIDGRVVDFRGVMESRPW